MNLVFLVILIGDKFYFFSVLFFLIKVFYVSQVAINILSEKEKKDLNQLVCTMVSYSITYKNVKSNPMPSEQRCEATSDASVLTFDPPISDFVDFKV